MGRDGRLYPLYVNANEPFEIGVWMKATPGPMLPNGKVKARKLNQLAYRPGFHSTEIPYETHIGNKGPSGKIESIPDEYVWVEINYKDDVDYQPEANANGINNKGNFNPRDAYIKRIAKDGYYRYKTNPNMTGDWIISGEMRINRILSDDEVNRICARYGLTPLPRTSAAVRTSNRKSKQKRPFFKGLFKKKGRKF